MILILKTYMRIASLLILLTLLSGKAKAQWSVNPSINTSIAVGTVAQECKSIPDGFGGAIFTWIDFRNDLGGYTRRDIYAQRVDINGVPQWTSNGVAICTVIASNRYITSIITDNAGGAIITWQDDRSGFTNIYTQHINGGTLQWTPADGIVITAVTTGLSRSTTVSDEAGGAIIIWVDNRTATDIYAQRINAAGVPQWAANGMPISLTTVDPNYLRAVTDGSGGAFISWYQSTVGSYKVYAQRIIASGTAWAGDAQVSTLASAQLDPEIAADGFGGAVITWSNNSTDVYAQRFNGSGSPLWTSDGVAVIANGNSPILVSDDAGGAIISWFDASTYVYAKRLDSGGNEVWTGFPLGVPIYTDIILQTLPLIASDRAGGAIITWIDSRAGDMDLYAQRINASGGLNWTINGVLIATEVFSNGYETAVVSDGTGGAIFSWQDIRSGSEIYTQNICADGTLACGFNPLLIELLSFTATCNAPSNENEIPEVILNWSTASELNNDYFTLERSYDLLTWQLIGKLNGAGNSNRILNYSLSDSFSNATKEDGPTKYYRLTQTDYNSDSKTFDLTSCNCATGNIMKFEVYPIPSTESLTIDFKNFHHQNLTIQIIDIFGRIIKKEEITDFSNNSYILDISMFSPGRYFLKVNDLTKSENVIFIKQ